MSIGKPLRLAIPALLSGIGLSSMPMQVSAVDFIQNATGACQPALPAFDGQIRKRPLAVQNEGTAPAFVSCSLTGTTSGVGGSGGRTVETVWLYARNATATSATLGCTLVDNFSGNATPTAYIPKSLVLPPGGAGVLQWDAADNGGVNYILVANFSCSLPVGVGLTLTRVDYRDP